MNYGLSIAPNVIEGYLPFMPSSFSGMGQGELKLAHKHAFSVPWCAQHLPIAGGRPGGTTTTNSVAGWRTNVCIFGNREQYFKNVLWKVLCISRVEFKKEQNALT